MAVRRHSKPEFSGPEEFSVIVPEFKYLSELEFTEFFGDMRRSVLRVEDVYRVQMKIDNALAPDVALWVDLSNTIPIIKEGVINYSSSIEEMAHKKIVPLFHVGSEAALFLFLIYCSVYYSTRSFRIIRQKTGTALTELSTIFTTTASVQVLYTQSQVVETFFPMAASLDSSVLYL